MPLNCMLKMVKMKNFYVYVYLIMTKIPPPHVSKLKARNEKLQVPKLRTDLGAGRDSECKYLTKVVKADII